MSFLTLSAAMFDVVLSTGTLIDLLLKATLLLCTVLVGLLLMRRTSAAKRHHVLGLCLAGLIALPLLSLFCPAWRILPNWTPPPTAAPISVNRTTTPNPKIHTESINPPVASVQFPAKSNETPSASASEPSGLSAMFDFSDWRETVPRNGVGVVWLVGVVLVLFRLVRAQRRLRITANRARMITDGSWRRLTNQIGKEIGLSRPVRLLQSDRATIPMTWGLFEPTILLPADTDQWSAPRRRIVLMHELAHVQRRDGVWLLLSQLACAMYWCHPLVWLATHRLADERERACDDLVLAHGVGAADYAEHLFHIASHHVQARALGAAAIGMARSSKLERRIRLIVDAARNRAGLTRRFAVMLMLLLAAVVIPLAMLQAAEPNPTTVQAQPVAVNSSEVESAADPVGPFILYGNATDAQGQPMSGVEITAHCGYGSLKRTGLATTNEQGDYELRFGPGMHMEVSTEAPRGIGMQAATIFASKPGYFEMNLNLNGDLYIAETPVKKDNAWNADPQRVVLPDQPRMLNFVMMPAAVIKGRLINADDQPLADHSIWLTGKKLPLSSSVLTSIKTDADGRFEFDHVPTERNWRYGLRVLDTHDEVETASIQFDQPGEYNVALVYDPTSKPNRPHGELKAQLVNNQAQADKPSDPVLISGRIVMEDGSPATVKGWLYSKWTVDTENSMSVSSGTEGLFTDQFSIRKKSGTLLLKYFAPGFAPAWVGPLEPSSGQKMAEVVLTLKSGFSAPLRVVNEQGRPIPTATFYILPVTNGSSDGPVHNHNVDGQGRFLLEHLADAPYEFRVTAPGYEPLSSKPIEVKADEPIKLIMIQSQPTTGVVLDLDGAPIKGARILQKYERNLDGPNRSGASPYGNLLAVTDEQGRFTLDQLRSGSHYLMIVETPDVRRAAIYSLRAGQKNIQITAPPRRDLRVRIVGDLAKLSQRQGKPFIGLRQRLTTDPQLGERSTDLIGEDAPVTPIDQGGVADYQGLVSGTVEIKAGPVTRTVDVLEQGVTEVVIDLTPLDQLSQTNPSVETTVDPPASEKHKTQFVSQEKKADDELATDQPTMINIIIAKHVLIHNNQVVTWDQVEKIIEQAPGNDNLHPTFYTTNGMHDVEGRYEQFKDWQWALARQFNFKGMTFSSISPKASFRLDAVRRQADLIPDEVLRRDGRALLADGTPATAAQVVLFPALHPKPPRYGDDDIYHVYMKDGRVRGRFDEITTHTDDQGRFTVYPPKGEKYRIVVFHDKGFARVNSDAFTELPQITLQPWGRIEGAIDPESLKQGKQYVSVKIRHHADGDLPELLFDIQADQFDEDGRFTIEQAPPGDGDMDRFIQVDHNTSRGMRVQPITIKPGQTQELIVADFTAQQRQRLNDMAKWRERDKMLRDKIKVGDPTPALSAVTLDDKPLKLSDYRGKFVLLDFWATWCEPCREQTPHLKTVYDTFGGDKRFVMIGLSLDREVSDPKQYVVDNEMQWVQGFLGDWSKTNIPETFGVSGIPAIMLIGPDGKVIAENLRHDKIKEAVAKALRDR